MPYNVFIFVFLNFFAVCSKKCHEKFVQEEGGVDAGGGGEV